MGVYIKGMEMPKSCRDCGIEQEGFWCGALDGYQNTRCFTNERREDCPLIEIPPHGRLIEKNAVFELIRSFPNVDRQLPVEFMKALYELPTIIQAEEGE